MILILRIVLILFVCLFVTSCKKHISDNLDMSVVIDKLREYCQVEKLDIKDFQKEIISSDEKYDWCITFVTMPEQIPRHILLLYVVNNKVVKQRRMIEP